MKELRNNIINAHDIYDDYEDIINSLSPEIKRKITLKCAELLKEYQNLYDIESNRGIR